MAGLGFNNRRRGMPEDGGGMMGGIGLGLDTEAFKPAGEMETAEYRPGDRDPMLDANPEMDEDSDYGPPGDFIGDEAPGEMGSDAWADVDETDFMSWLRTQPTDITKFLLDTYRKRGAQEDERPEPDMGRDY